MGGTARGLGMVGVIALGCVAPRWAMAAEESAGVSARPREAKICSASKRAGLVVCFGDRGLGPEEQGPVEDKIRMLLDKLAREGFRLSAGQRLLVRVDGIRPNLVFHVEPVGDDGATPAGWEKRFAECERDVGCTTEDWHGVVSGAMKEALIELREGSRRSRVGSGPSEPQRYRPMSLGIAGIITTSVGGLGLLTGAGLMIAGGLRDIPTSGFRQERDFLPLSRDLETPGAVTLGVSAAVATAGIVMVVVDHRHWKSNGEAAKASGRRARLRLTVSPWGRGLRVGGRF